MTYDVPTSIPSAVHSTPLTVWNHLDAATKGGCWLPGTPVGIAVLWVDRRRERTSVFSPSPRATDEPPTDPCGAMQTSSNLIVLLLRAYHGELACMDADAEVVGEPPGFHVGSTDVNNGKAVPRR